MSCTMVIRSLLMTLVLFGGAAGCASGRAVVLDGSFEDWSGIMPMVSAAESSPDEGAFVDFGAVRVAHDSLFVHLLVELGNEVNPQGLDGTVTLLLDCDGDPRTPRPPRPPRIPRTPGTWETRHGLAGVDVMIDLSPLNPDRPGRPGHGVSLRSATYQPDPTDETQQPLNPYDIGFAFAPTYASSTVEFRIKRGAKLPATPALFTGSSFTGRLVFADLAGEVVEATDAFTYDLSGGPARSAVLPQPTDPLARGDGSLRIASWNLRRNALFLNSEASVRTLAALAPDVILMQEFMDGVTADQLAGFFNSHLPLAGSQRWHAVFGDAGAGGDLHCAVVSRYPLQAIEELSWITLADNPNRSVRAVGTLVEIDGKHLLATSVHLKCCGRNGGREDETRMAEVKAIRSAIGEVCRARPVDAIVVAGDFNLVGGRPPLDAMAQGSDLDGSSLAIPMPLQLDGATNATWEDPAQPFTAGKLDYLLFSDSTLKLARGIVLDSRDLADRWLEHHDLTSGDTAAVSDHLPLVVDVTWVGGD